MNKLTEILDEELMFMRGSLALYMPHRQYDSIVLEQQKLLETALLAWVDEVIGEDLDQVPEEYDTEHFVIQTVNFHKAKARKRARS